MRTIRHKASPTINARSGYDDDTGTMTWIVTVPWRDGQESENHGHPVLPQLGFDIEGPDGDIVEDVTLSAADTYDLYRALNETYEHLDWLEPGCVEDAIEQERQPAK